MLHAQDDARVEMVQLQFEQLSSTVRASSLPLSIDPAHLTLSGPLLLSLSSLVP